MQNILAIDTATEACSVTLRAGGEVSHRYELIPRQHSSRIFSMIREVLPDEEWPEGGIDLLAFTHGPGSFTGLRIAASAVQGLAYANTVPVAGISTLACLAQGCWRRGLVGPEDRVLVLVDARINEVYWGYYELRDGVASALLEDAVCAPDEIPVTILDSGHSIVGVGSGLPMLDQVPAELADGISGVVPDLWPDSFDLLALADAMRVHCQEAAGVQPVYLRNEIHWKKLSEQGRT
jgi:tRNA threonylcarbamoyladenosine biosynthesis protein TsaB